jgi:hypothetical protein
LDKIKVISIGGLEEKILDKVREQIDIAHWRDSRRSIPSTFAADAAAIVIITKFAGTTGRERAREASANHGDIPILAAATWNYVIHEILECDKLYMWHHTLKNGDSEREPKKTAEPPKEVLTDMRITERRLWETHGDLLVSVAKALFLPGEKMDINEFLPDLAKEAGLSEADTRKMLPYLAVAGVLDNPVGDTWRLLGSEFILDLEPAPKPEVETESQRTKMLGLLRGLKPGPYPSRYAIEKEAMAHRDFAGRSGKPLCRMMVFRYVKAALDEGIIKSEGGGFRVVGHDPSVKLTRIPEKELETRGPATKKREAELKVSDDVKFLRDIVGDVGLPTVFGIEQQYVWDVVKAIKKEVPATHWNRLAENSCMAILRKKGVSPKPIPRELFKDYDWDILAWETLKGFKVEIMAPYLKMCHFDEDIKCANCGEWFRFTKAEKGFYYEKELAPPARCAQCRRKS